MNNLEDFFSVETRPEVCEKHGAFESHKFMRNHWTKCPVCSAEQQREAERQDAEAKAAKERERIMRRINCAGIPERFVSRTLESFIVSTPAQAKALQFAEDYVSDFANIKTTGRSAVFVGKPGTGKTHLAAGICLSVIDKNIVAFTTTLRAIRRIKDTWSKGSTETETQAVAALVTPDLLVLDEVGVQFGSEVEKMILFDVLNERYEKRKPTLLLSNLPMDEIKTYLGERIFDRLREDGGRFVVFDWESYRGKVKA